MDVLAAVPDFHAERAAKCAELGIDVAGYPVSHVAVRTRTWRDYLDLREALEEVSRPLDVANACVFLASTLASWITGQDLVVDGGISAAPAY